MLVFRFYISFKAACVQIERDVFERKARGGKLLKLKFKEMHIVGLLVNFGARLHKRFVDR